MPVYPIIVIGKWGHLELANSPEHFRKGKVYGLFNNFYTGFTAYDKDGICWKIDQVKTSYPINVLTKFLAFTIYNPSVNILLSWKKKGDYEIVDLKKIVNKQIDKDDDVLTQFEDSKVIQEAIRQAASFEELVSALNKYIFDVNEGPLQKEIDP